jgi:hypothetical protein
MVRNMVSIIRQGRINVLGILQTFRRFSSLCQGGCLPTAPLGRSANPFVVAAPGVHYQFHYLISVERMRSAT